MPNSTPVTSSEDNVSPPPSQDMPKAVTVMCVMLVDLVLYGCIIPLVGTYFASGCVVAFSLAPGWELVLTLFFTFSFLYIAFACCGESFYWKHLFAYEGFYANLLIVRDAVNFMVVILCLTGIASTVESMVEDRSMKPERLTEGTGYVFTKTFLSWLQLNYESILPSLGLKLPHGQKMTDLNFGENERYEHAGTFMLLFAMLTACIAKLVYFNTLFTYIRAMDIFLSLKPSFEDDDDAPDEDEDPTPATK